MSSSMQILHVSTILFVNINEWSSNGTRFYRVNQFSFYQDTIVRILQCLVHKVNSMQYIFFLVQKFQLLSQIDSVLQLSLYTSTSDWELVSLRSLNSELYLIDVSSVPEFKSLCNNVFLRCHWNVDFM
jgi:hypothetical protein